MLLNRLYFTILSLFAFISFSSCGSKVEQQKGVSHIPVPTNVIVFIGDGMGFNQVRAGSYYEYGMDGVQVYEQEGWTILASATYAAVTRMTETDTVFGVGYNPRSAWQDESYLRQGATGSAESATALSTGVKTYSPSIGIGIDGDTLLHISQVAKALGKSSGVVSSVQMSHATPAGFAAHNRLRSNYEEIAAYLLFNTRLDLIMAAGNPDYDNNGRLNESSARFVGGRSIWEQLKGNAGRAYVVVDGDTLHMQDVNGDGEKDAWTLVQERDAFIALAQGETPTRVLGIPMVNTTLNYGREGEDKAVPFSQPLNENVPTLQEMTLAALNVLGKNPKGFFVMIEGGAIDWAGHDNHLGRMIEEQIDFNNAVRAAVEWVETHSSWDETLIIVTSDHETGYLTGPDHPEIVNQAIVNQGKGELPEVKWNSGGHTNQLVPFYARGAGAELFTLYAEERDPVRGPFVQSSELAQALFMMWGRPEAASGW